MNSIFSFLFLGFLLSAPSIQAAEEIAAAGAPKVLLGSEGKRIDLLEVNSSKQAIVRFKNIGGEWEGKTILWSLDTTGPDNRDIYFEKKKGSKMERFVPLIQRQGRWQLYTPEFPGKGIHFYYSTADSEKLQATDLIESYKNQKK